MSIVITDSNLEQATWITQTGKNINPIPSDAYLAVYDPADRALVVTNLSSQAEGGALVTCKRPIPVYGNIPLSHARLTMEIFISPDDLPYLMGGRFENDVKFCLAAAQNSSTPIANIANGSTQYNLDPAKMMFQIDNTGKQWADTGISVGVPGAGVWIPMELRYEITPSSYSVEAIGWEGTLYPIPQSMQNLPLQQSNWQDLVAAVQLQTEVGKPGALRIKYRNITLQWSDQPWS